MYHNQIKFFPGIQVDLTYRNQYNKTVSIEFLRPCDHLNRQNKSIQQKSTPFHG